MSHTLLALFLLAMCPSAAFPMGAGGGGGGGSAGTGGSGNGGASAGGDHRYQQSAKVPTRSQSAGAPGKQSKYGRG